MSILTLQLMGRPTRNSKKNRWKPVFEVVTERLVESYGVPTLGNFRDPVEEIFYIVLSARTTDAQYRRTHRKLRKTFPTLPSLADASVEAILPCILGGGLANKRAEQVKKVAERLVEMGEDPADRIRSMSAREAFEFLTGLPGMGPKSAFCVMMYSLKHEVFPVDVNVQRIASRMGAIPNGLKHYQAQQRLPTRLPDRRNKALHIGLVVHGRKVCLPKNPRCADCVLIDLCRFGRKKLEDRKREREA